MECRRGSQVGGGVEDGVVAVLEIDTAEAVQQRAGGAEDEGRCYLLNGLLASLGVDNGVAVLVGQPMRSGTEPTSPGGRGRA